MSVKRRAAISAVVLLCVFGTSSMLFADRIGLWTANDHYSTSSSITSSIQDNSTLAHENPQAPSDNNTNGTRPGTRTGDSPSGEPISSTGADSTRDLVTRQDPSALRCISPPRIGTAEFYDRRINQLVRPPNAFLFDIRYADDTALTIRVHPEVGPEAEARDLATLVAEGVGRLPSVLRRGILRVGILDGDLLAQADGGGEGILLHADNLRTRVADNRLEETLFHEAVHTSLDDRYRDSPEWTAAQQVDGQYLTAYGRKNPATEDLAETALYAYALLYHPDRILEAERAAWQQRIPNRLQFIKEVLPPADNDPGAGITDCP